MVHAYNSTRHDTTGVSPFYLMFGREPKLPIDVAFGIENQLERKQPTSKYSEHLKKKLQISYELAQKHSKSSQERQKHNYDTKVRGATLHVGDKVLVKILAFDGRHKLSDKWEEEIYIVKEKPNSDIPIYKV